MSNSRLNLFRNRSFRAGAVFSTGVNALAKVLSFAVSALIAFFYGTRETADVFFYALGTVMLMAFFARGMNSAVLIPEAMRLAEQSSQQRSRNFLNLFLYLLLGISIGFACLLLLRPVDIFSGISRFDADVLLREQGLLSLAVPLLPLMVVSFYLGDILVSFRFFTVPMLLNALTHFMVILSVLLLHNRLGVASALLGLIAGLTLQCAVLLAFMRAALQWDFRPRAVRVPVKVWKDLLYAQSGNAVTALSKYVPLMLISGYGKGAVAALSYASRVAELPTELLTNQVSAVFGIRVNRLVSRREYGDLARIFRSTAAILMFVLLPVSGLLFLYHREVIILLFARGNFALSSVALSSGLLRYLALILPLFAVNTLFARVLMAGRKISIAFWAQVLQNAAMILGVVLGLHWMGLVGYPIGRLVIYTLYVLLAIPLILRKTFPSIPFHETLRRFALLFAVNVCICVLLTACRPWLPQGSASGFIAGTLVYGAVLLVSSKLLGIDADLRRVLKALFTGNRARQR